MNIQYWIYEEKLFEQLFENVACIVERQYKLCHFMSRRHLAFGVKIGTIFVNIYAQTMR